MSTTHTFSKHEEIVNSITHGIGALLSIAALVLLIVFSYSQGTLLHVISFSIFGSTMLLLYVSSTLVHSFPPGKAKDIFEIMDHASIYLFIAGTYTPFLFIVIKGWLGWTLFGVIWGMAILGVVFKIFFVKRFLYLSTVIYLLMGWLIVFAWKPLVSILPTGGVIWLVLGGILYSIGTIFYMWRGFKFHHAVWHLFVLAGSIAHFFAILLYVLPIQG
ncbi:PAQR family membrane homeostasis protein TrhA [Bacillus sp. Marseille-P3661]|uniref:PAQR family membrane homeostasis protein TrhA n=1 Tax=Bacillus sp. Marseille-P3661 TaxID=1936234 RepID=UPI000C8380FB|nr:hemolysin III family protein [Bacillus sp. Marseille-P3661]